MEKSGTGSERENRLWTQSLPISRPTGNVSKGPEFCVTKGRKTKLVKLYKGFNFVDPVFSKIGQIIGR